jgi:glycosyltransferase involved in cell wall biosynthesis
MKHILMIAYTSYVSDARIRREAETLASLDRYKVVLFAPKEGKKARTYEQGGVTVLESRLPKYQGDSFLLYLLSYCVFTALSFWLCLTQVVRGKLDVVHVHNMPNFLIFGALPVRLRRGKIVLDVHDTMLETYASKFDEDKNTLLQKILKIEESICTRLADAVVAVNEPQAEVLVGRGVPRNKITVSMNVPDDRLFNYGFQTAEREVNPSFRTVYHGTIARRHGVDQAIQAVALLKDRIPGIELNILGYGDYMEKCRHLVRKLGAADYIHFDGMFTIEDMIVFLEKMDLEIVTNRKNPASDLMLPVKLMECVALGLPVVTARLRTIEYYFSDDMVYFFEPEDLDSLVETIFEAYSNRETTRKKAQTAKRFLDKYGWNTHKQDLFDLYIKLEQS